MFQPCGPIFPFQTSGPISPRIGAISWQVATPTPIRIPPVERTVDARRDTDASHREHKFDDAAPGLAPLREYAPTLGAWAIHPVPEEFDIVGLQ